MLQILAPTFTSVGETHAAITKRCVGPAGYRVARFLAEQPAVLDVGSLALHGETTAMVLPVVLHNEVPGGQTEMVILHRFANLDDARVGYAKHIIEDLLRALARPWVPALLDVWKARGEAAQEFVEQVSAGRCFLCTAELMDIARKAGVCPQVSGTMRPCRPSADACGDDRFRTHCQPRGATGAGSSTRPNT